MPEKINRNEVQTLVKNGALIVEVLGHKEYHQAHLPHAINIPLWEIDAETAAQLGKKSSVIVYCYDYQ